MPAQCKEEHLLLMQGYTGHETFDTLKKYE
jgi:hypothetical protein